MPPADHLTMNLILNPAVDQLLQKLQIHNSQSRVDNEDDIFEVSDVLCYKLIPIINICCAQKDKRKFQKLKNKLI